MTKDHELWGISSNWIIPTLSLIPTKKSHTRFVLLTHSMVSDIASLVVGAVQLVVPIAVVDILNRNLHTLQ